MFYEETPSQWNLGYNECNEFLTKILNKLKLCGESNIEKYLFNNQISKETKEQILKFINEQLLIDLKDGKLENYRSLYSNMNLNDLALPDRFVRYYCENYYMMKNCDYFGKSLERYLF